MNIRIKAIAQMETESSELGLMAQLYRENENKKIDFLKDITVPIQGKKTISGKKLSLDKGKYIFQVLLPNGQTFTKDFEVKSVKKRENLIIHLPLGILPEESHTQMYTENFLRRNYLLENLTKTLSDNLEKNYRSHSNLRDEFELSFLKPDENSGSEIFVEKKTIENLSNLIQENLDIKTAIQKLGTSLKIEEPTQKGNNFALFRIAYSGVIPSQQVLRNSQEIHIHSNFSRQYLLQKSYSSGTIVSLPIPWILPKNKGETEIELLVKDNSIGESTDFAMTINEPTINTVLGYINIGAIQQAMQLISTERAIKMLFEKINNPFAAVLGAYILILNSNQKRNARTREYWKSWVNNLDYWFEWLPDGAILNAAKHFWLRDYSRNDENEATISYNQSLEALNRSYDRGLPFFTFGLKLMIDGFRYFANEGEGQAEERLAILEPIADRTDPSQPFLTITFSQYSYKKYK